MQLVLPLLPSRHTPRTIADEFTTPDLEELAQQAVEALSARDFDALMRFFAPDAIHDTGPLGAGMFEGRAAIRGFLEDLMGPYEEYSIQAEEIRDLGGGVVFGAFVQRGRLPGSTAWVQVRLASVTTLAGGLIQRFTTCADVDQARAAAERLAEERG